MFNCLADIIPGSGIFRSTLGEDGSNEFAEELNLASLGVKHHEILGCSTEGTLSSGRFEQRYFFLIPGKLVSSSQAFADSEIALRDAMIEAFQGPVPPACLDISPTFIVEFINPKCFRVRNADTVIPAIVPLSTDPAVEPTLAPLAPLEEEQALNLHFQTPEAATLWAEAIMAERDRLYLPTLASRDLDFCKALHIAIWKGYLYKRDLYDDFWAFYYRCDRGVDGPEQLFIILYDIFARIVPKEKMSGCVPAFLEVLEIMTTNVATRLLMLSMDITVEFLTDFEAYLRPILEAEASETKADQQQPDASPSSPAAVPTIAGYLQNLMLRPLGIKDTSSMSPDVVSALARHIQQLALNPSFAPNVVLLPRIYGFPDSSGVLSLGSKMHCRWLNELHAGRGSVSFPVKISWAQAQLLMLPSPFCGYFFLDYAIEGDDVRRARATCQLLPYSMTERFDAIHVNGDGAIDHAAHYIAYLEWDALQRGYEEYEIKNKDNARMQVLLGEARDVYSVPICTASHLELGTMTPASVMQDFISQLLEKVEDEDEKHVRCLRKVLGHWMSFTRETVGVVEVPRKAHLITLLVLSNWLSRRPAAPVSAVLRSKSTPVGKLTPASAVSEPGSWDSSVLIGRVTEGEDRALILAIAATDMVLTHGKSVHIMYSTAKELFRDFTRVQPYYQAVELTASMNDFGAKAQVTYCLQRDLTQYYRDAVFNGQSPTTDTLLFLHDVPSLSSGASPNSIYGKKDEVLSGPFREFIDVLAALSESDSLVADLPIPAPIEAQADGASGGDPPVAPTAAAASTHSKSNKGNDAVRSIAWSKAKQGWAEFKAMKADRPQGYTKQGDTLVVLDAEGKPCPLKYSLGIEVARYQLLGIEPVINSKFYFQSMPSLFGSYDCILGLEALPEEEPGVASSGASAKKVSKPSTGRDFLEQALGLWTFNIPNDEAQKNFGSLHQSADLFADKERNSAAANSPESPTSGGLPSPPQADLGSPRSGPVIQSDPVSLISKGAIMADLCDRFYRTYPYSAEKGEAWPSSMEHRRLVQFLESEELHTPDGVQDFAQALRLGKK